MTAYDVRAQQQAARTLAPKPAGKGQAVTLTWQGAGSYDPATGSTTEPEPETQDCSGFEKHYESYRIDGTNILSGDTRFMLSPLTTQGQPVEFHEGEEGSLTLTLASDITKTVVKAYPFRPAGLVIYAYLHLRGAG